MKKIFFYLSIFFFTFIFLFTSIDSSNASSFIRRRDREHRDDSRHGKNWDKMDKDLDNQIDGRHSERPEQHRFQRPRPEQRPNTNPQSR
jgi:hypothetical protein